MIAEIRLIRNVGAFDSVTSHGELILNKLTLIYAENGRGKTTLTSILRALASNNSATIQERHRLGSTHSPHVVLSWDNGSTVFENGTWNNHVPKIRVFDDEFVDKNVYSGLAVDPDHRQNLHDLVIGSTAVALNLKLQEYVQTIEELNASIRRRRQAIPESIRGGLSIEEFCRLPPLDDPTQTIRALEQELVSAQQSERITQTEGFTRIDVPRIDLESLSRLLSQELSSLDAVALAKVQEHLGDLGKGSEDWIAKGMAFTQNESGTDNCPFCGQLLASSPLVDHYRMYFSTEYNHLKANISDYILRFTEEHGANRHASFERQVRKESDLTRFWSEFSDVPSINLELEKIVKDWTSTWACVLALLNAKQSSPLEVIAIPFEVINAIQAHEGNCNAIEDLNHSLEEANQTVTAIKRQAAHANLKDLEAKLARAKLQFARYHTPDVAEACEGYLSDSSAKEAAEQGRDRTRAELDEQRTAFFQTYQAGVNEFLLALGAAFRLDSMSPAQVRSGATCTYQIVVNSAPIAIATNSALGSPSFRTLLSAGDRSTLALAFFFASLSQDTNLSDMMVVIDDPVSSMDEFRLIATAQHIRRLVPEVHQAIVLSHNRRFLATVWEHGPRSACSTLSIIRETDSSSTLIPWPISQDALTEHDLAFKKLKDYLKGPAVNSRSVAEAIRPFLEGFLRVVYPDHFPPGTLLGSFINTCNEALRRGDSILPRSRVQELDDIKEYANRFHHDNPNWQTAEVNDGELVAYTRRALEFAGRPIL